MMVHLPYNDNQIPVIAGPLSDFLYKEYRWIQDFVWKPDGKTHSYGGRYFSLGNLYVTEDLAIILKLKFSL